MAHPLSRPDLHEQLTRWVADGLLDTEQASRIEAAETTRTAKPGALGGRAPLVVEALGYLGGAMAIIAGFIAVAQLWPDIPPGAQAAFAAAGTVLLGIVGTAMRTGGDPAFARLRSVLWLMSAACLAACTAVLAARVWHVSGTSTVLLAAAVATGYAVVLWRRTEAPLQHLALFAGAAVTIGAGIARVADDGRMWGPGLGVWILSVLWGAAAHRGHLRPRTAGYLAAAAGVLVGAQLTMDVAAGHLLAIATVVALLASGVALQKVWLLAIGAIGVIQVVPQTATRYLPDSLAAPLAILAVGIVLLGAALWLAKQAKPPTPRHG